MTDLKQALRNAIEVEKAASRFYRDLAARTSDREARSFLEKMTADEMAHAEALERKVKELVEGKLPDWPDFAVESVEAAPDWECAEDVSYADALRVALEAEQHAELFYDSIADTAPTEPAREFFRDVAQTEAKHAEAIARLIEKLAS